jgi:hypothetical protein
MSMLRYLMTCGFAIGVSAGVSVAASAASKDALTRANMAELHRLIRPQADEYRWDQVSWYATGGAGFNDPLGNC